MVSMMVSSQRNYSIKQKKIRGKRHRTKTNLTLKNQQMGYNTYRKDGVEYAPTKVVCNNQIRCSTGSAVFSEVIEDVCNALRKYIEEFDMVIDNNQSESIKLHENILNTQEAKLAEIELKELNQWEALHDPNPEKRMPQHIFQKLNEKLLVEKEEIKQSLYETKMTIPRQIDYKELSLKFSDAVKALENPDISAKIKNQYLKDIIERIDYDRPPNVRITKKNAAKYNTVTSKGMKIHTEPFKIEIKLK